TDAQDESFCGCGAQIVFEEVDAAPDFGGRVDTRLNTQFGDDPITHVAHAGPLYCAAGPATRRTRASQLSAICSRVYRRLRSWCSTSAAARAPSSASASRPLSPGAPASRSSMATWVFSTR